MTLAEWAWEYDDQALDETVGIGLVNALGLDDLPNIETNDSPRHGTDGNWRGQDFARGRTFTVTMDLSGRTDAAIRETEDALKAVFTLRRSEDKAFRWRLGGSVAKRIYCRCLRRSLPLDFARITREPQAVVQLEAANFRIYADDESNGTTLIGASSAGTSWPVSWPLSWGGASSAGQIEADNDGDFPAPWVATLTGELVNPYLACGAARLSLTGTVATGDSLTLDSLNKTILLNGTASRYEWLDVGAEWFELEPGENEVQFGADSGDGTLTLVWRSTWI